MKKLAAITLTSMMLLLATAMVVGAVEKVEVRGAVATADTTWNSQNFAGFYYDIKDDIGTETLSTTITGEKKLSGDSPYGVKYETKAQSKEIQVRGLGHIQCHGLPGRQVLRRLCRER